jgi:cysteinyl-tRNA synthetase
MKSKKKRKTVKKKIRRKTRVIKKTKIILPKSELLLYNTLTKKKELFVPVKRKNKDFVSLYACGPTVYWYQHIGNLRTYIFEDILKRVFEFNGYKVRHVINITDVGHLTSDSDEGEDKMLKALKRENLPLTKDSMLALAEKYTQVFKQDFKKLNIIEPDIWPKATQHIHEMQELIKKIEKKGFTYKTKVGLIFDTSKFKNYSKLGRLKLKELKQGSRTKKDPERKNPSDFALWITNQPKHVMQWDSPWGRGFPGWHIECSAMSMKYLGKTIDIHTGGEEHIPIHHTNEIAQSEAATGKKFVKYWLHARWLLFKGDKMSKSEGNIYTISELENKGYDPLAYRYFCLTAHYRTQLEFSWERLDEAQKIYNNLKEKISEIKQNLEIRGIRSEKILDYKKEFKKAINDDLNMPKALAVFWKMLKSDLQNNEKYSLVLMMDSIFALELDKVKKEKMTIPEKISQLINQREKARENKNFDLADKLREQIKLEGYIIEDTPRGPKIKKIK